jgi:hypothetical protein
MAQPEADRRDVDEAPYGIDEEVDLGRETTE